MRDHRQCALDGREHPECQAIDLEQTERVEVVLVPLNDGALVHRSVFDRHHPLEEVARDDEAADVLGQVAWEALQLAGECHQPRNQRILRVEAGFPDAGRIDTAPVPPREYASEPLDLREIEAKRLAHVAHRALRPVGDERGGQRGALAGIFPVDVLHHLLAPLMLEVDVDVGRLVAPFEMKRSNRTLIRDGSTSVMPSA